MRCGARGVCVELVSTCQDQGTAKSAKSAKTATIGGVQVLEERINEWRTYVHRRQAIADAWWWSSRWRLGSSRVAHHPRHPRRRLHALVGPSVLQSVPVSSRRGFAPLPWKRQYPSTLLVRNVASVTAATGVPTTISWTIQDALDSMWKTRSLCSVLWKLPYVADRVANKPKNPMGLL